MSDLAPAIIEGARLFASVKKDQARYDYLSNTGGTRAKTISPVYVAEETVPGVELNNYTNRKEIEGGTHVLIVEHKEHLEKVLEPEVPPTPEELEKFREEKRFMAKVWASVASVAIVVAGIVVIVERKNAPKTVPLPE